MFLGLRTTVYFVNDLPAARDWYARVLEATPYFDTPYYVGFSVGGFELGLHPAEDGRAPGLGGHAAYWGVLDAEAAHARLIALGATSLQAPHDVGGGIVVGAVTDPFGNELGIIFNPHFGKATPEA
mgnify:CR=1 FL=1